MQRRRVIETASFSSSSGGTTTRGSRMSGLLYWRVVVGEHFSYSCLEVVDVVRCGRQARLSGEACVAGISVSSTLDESLESMVHVGLGVVLCVVSEVTVSTV